MKKLLGLFIGLILTSLSAFSADMRFVQVTDTMLSVNNPSSVENLQKVIEDINKQRDISFVIFTGNNTSKPSEKNLICFLEEAKKLDVPFYLIPGNKDLNKQKDMGKNDYLQIVKKNLRSYKKIESFNYTFEKKGVIFICVDGSKDVIPTPNGYYRENTLFWLEGQLNKYQDKNVIILQHFPIVPPAKKEQYYTFKAEEYLTLLSKYDNVKAVISGLFGVNNEQTVDGILHISTQKSPSYRIIDILDYDTKNPSFWSICR